MCIFLIDYENVRDNGLKGVEYLDCKDHVILFYSDVSKNIRNDNISNIINSNCEFELIHLNHTGKNALDYYIALRTGELYSNGKDYFIIVSNDKGFDAIIEYYKNKNIKINRTCSVESGMTCYNSKRKNIILENRKIKDLSKYEIELMAKKSNIRRELICVREMKLIKGIWSL